MHRTGDMFGSVSRFGACIKQRGSLPKLQHRLLCIERMGCNHPQCSWTLTIDLLDTFMITWLLRKTRRCKLDIGLAIVDL